MCIRDRQSGGHRLSALAVAEGRADIAALDAVTHAMLQEVEPQVAALRSLALTDPTPGLPYITAADQDPEPVFAALTDAIAALPAPDRATLRLKGLVRIPLASYLAVPNPPSPGQIAAAG